MELLPYAPTRVWWLRSGTASFMNHYTHLGVFSDLVREAHRHQHLRPTASPGPETRERVLDVLGFYGGEEQPLDVQTGESWERDGVMGEEISWSVGYGPRTQGWVMKPAGVQRPLPGVLALHGHDGVKYFGKEKIADGPEGAAPGVFGLRQQMYGGGAFAESLAKEGFVVLVHDTFLWGSRRFPFEEMPDTTQRLAAATRDIVADVGDSGDASEGLPPEIALYEAAVHHHEHLVEKYCRLLGTNLAGVVAHEDRIAASYLLSRSDVEPSGVGCVGLSGGGCRAALLQSTCERVAAAAVVGMMSTHEHLLDGRVEPHTWMFFPDGLARYGDWPDLAACRAPSPLLVQYNRGDHLFSTEGMSKAHDRIASHYSATDRPEAYEGQFYDGPHKFDLPMQQAAFQWLGRVLVAG